MSQFVYVQSSLHALTGNARLAIAIYTDYFKAHYYPIRDPHAQIMYLCYSALFKISFYYYYFILFCFF